MGHLYGIGIERVEIDQMLRVLFLFLFVVFVEILFCVVDL